VLAAAAIVHLAVWGCAAGQTTSQTNPGARVGVLEIEKVFAETAAGKRAQESLNTFVRNRQALIELEAKELKRMEEDLIKQASVLSANARKEREDQFRRRVAEFQQKEGELNREIQEKQSEVLDGFREKVERITAKVAQQLELQVVIQKGRGRGSPIIYNEPTVDVSGKVIEEFSKEHP
jgi:outer membrane protein